MKNLLQLSYHNNKNQNGISFIKSIIKIVIVLIIGGTIHLSMPKMSVVENIVGMTDIVMAKEQAELMSASYIIEYYDDRYVDQSDVPVTIGDYIVEKLKTGVESGDYYMITDEKGILTVYKNHNSKLAVVVSGKVDENGSVIW